MLERKERIVFCLISVLFLVMDFWLTLETRYLMFRFGCPKQTVCH